ncbi:MAG TPA: carboxylate--amine ligase [Lachnospiraceae bacterium]|nr:carboxylate--amine ligase [Lachnospiraceae bacterium]
MKVMVTNAEYKHTLAAVRSMGKKGVDVFAASNSKRALSFYSRYCRRRFLYSNPIDERNFIDDILNILENNNLDVLLPIGFNACMAIAKHQAELTKYVGIPIASYDSMKIASDKNQTIKFASNNNIPHAETYYPENLHDVEELSKCLKYPVVIKSPEESGSVKYANSKGELLDLYDQVCRTHKSQVDRGKHPQIQEYIQGDGYGFFALFNHGEPRAVFAHKRLHEYPPTGGPSTMAKSFYDPDLQAIGIRILKKLNWHGVAMVEFKRDMKSNEYKLIEINPKFWGSLGLAIASGVDFPYLSSKMCIEGDIDPVFDYDKDLIYRWVFPDLVYALASRSFGEYISNLFNKNITNDACIGDVKPSILEFYNTMIEIAVRMKNDTLYYPHGNPMESI